MIVTFVELNEWKVLLMTLYTYISEYNISRIVFYSFVVATYKYISSFLGNINWASHFSNPKQGIAF